MLGIQRHGADDRAGRLWVPTILQLLWMACLLAPSLRGASVTEARQQWLTGNYTQCLAMAEERLREGSPSEEWLKVHIQALLTLGRYPEALTAATNALSRDARSLSLRWLAREAFLSNGQRDKASAVVDEILQYASGRPWAYRDSQNLVAFGRAALLRGADPKSVLDRIFAMAKKAEPEFRETYLAGGELALDKHDFALAAKTFQEGLQKLPEDPDLHFGLARAYAPSDRVQMIKSLEATLKFNTNHAPSLLLLADHGIDAEEYPAAEKYLGRVAAVNPWHPEAWAYRAVLAHLRNDPPKEETARATALRFWPSNPRVDHLIGYKLSQKYRFAEGAGHQRQALAFDHDYLPAKAQLSRDLLRLGEEAEGWKLAEEVHEKDGYDVAAFNLTTLRETMDKFTTLTNRDFQVRMSAHEAAVYGPRALDLLDRAKRALTAKYGLELTNRTMVEIFPEQKDFGVRTFGMPENPGFLGVCFGPVITANSPAAQGGQPVNWEAVLWHEFCHVVTLRMTRNKMPRWLSEGLSVYEELQANPAWGQHMTPRYREMILRGEAAPVSQLSSAFLTPRSSHHLQFAYYQCSLVVEFLAQNYGHDRLKAVLRDLGEGLEINRALEKRIAPMAKLDKDFAAFIQERAKQLGPKLDWEKPELEERAGGGGIVLDGWMVSHPNNFWALTRQAQQFIEDKKWQEAKAPLEKLIEGYPGSTGPDNAYRMLAAAHRALNETNQEWQVLSKYAELDAAAPETYLRLMELAAAARDWPGVTLNAQRYLAANPLVAPPYRHLAEASEQTGDDATAMAAYRNLLRLYPPNPAEVHFRLARLLHRAGDPAARRHVLQALEEAPRYREALRLLLEMNVQSPVKTVGDLQQSKRL